MGVADPLLRSAAPRAPAGTELVLVRHGQGRCNAAGVIGGRQGCSGLSPQGRWESVALAERLARLEAGRPFDVLVCSPRRRVVESAGILGARLGLRPEVLEALRGQEFGAADGRSWRDVVRAFGGPPSHHPDRPVAVGAESWHAYADRVLTALGALVDRHPGARILVVAHGRTAALGAALLAGAADPRAAAADLAIGHGELTRWFAQPDGWEGSIDGQI